MATADQTTSFDDHFRQWFPRLVSLGAVMVGRRDVAHEVAQEALWRTHQRWDEVAAMDAPGAWTRRVAVNLLIDHQRSSTAERTAIERLRTRPESASSSPEQSALDRWTELVAVLSERQRTIVTLYYTDDQSVETIAHTLDIAVGTVKAQLFKARDQLRRSAVGGDEAGDDT